MMSEREKKARKEEEKNERQRQRERKEAREREKERLASSSIIINGYYQIFIFSTSSYPSSIISVFIEREMQ